MSEILPSSAAVSAVVPSVITLEQTLVTLTAQVRALVQENAALRNQSGGNVPASVVASEWGFVANELDPVTGLAVAFQRIADDGGRWVRLWHGSFGPFSAATTRLIDLAAAAGLRVVLCVQPKDTKPASLGTPDFAAFAARNATSLKKVAFIEAGNELNLAMYRPDDLGGDGDWHRPYVDRWLRPLHAALAGSGVKVLCTSVTDTNHPETYATQYAALKAAGAADCCEGVALHAYALPQSLPSLSDVITTLRAGWGKPVYVTECNVFVNGLSPAQWQEQFPPYLAMLRKAGVAGAMFYRGFAKANGTWTWPVLFDNAGGPTDTYAALQDAVKTFV